MNGSRQFFFGCVLVMAGCASTDGPDANDPQIGETEPVQQAELKDEKKDSAIDLALITEVNQGAGAEVSAAGVIVVHRLRWVQLTKF